MSESTKKPRRKLNVIQLGIAAAIVLALIAGVFVMRGGNESALSKGTTFVVKRGNLDVTVTEGGTIEALESQEIRSQVQGRDGVKILSIVEEGYRVTEADVAAGKILVELDSSGLEDQMQSQTISVESAEASFIERQAEYDLQLNQNKSSITAANLTAKFALMDFKKFLGERAVADILQNLNLDDRADRLYKAIDTGAYTKKPELPQLPGSNSLGPVGEGGVVPENPEIMMDRELMEAIGKAMQEAGVPIDPSRFRGGGGERPRDGRASGGGEWVGGDGGQESGGGGPGGGSRMVSPEMIDRMKQMGVDVVEIAQRLGKIKQPELEEAAAVEDEANALTLELDAEYTEKRADLEFAKYADTAFLEDGEAKQQLRTLRDEILVTEEDLRLATKQLEGQRRLAEKQFITQTELELEEVKVKKAEIRLQSSETAERLYVTYEFPKEAERFLSDYEEALASLERTVRDAQAELSQQKARLKSAQSTYLVEMEQLRELEEQLVACRIKAERPGLVVYGSSTESGRGYRGSSQEPIAEGTSVRERQLIITIPDMTKMGVNVSIHESAVKRVTTGQLARAVADANPDSPISAEVIRVAVLPDSGNMWMNPDLKLYKTVLRIPETVDWIRPGMSAQVQILIDELRDVLYIPIQAISAYGDKRIVYVNNGGGVSMREVTTGQYTADYIEIKEGLQEGDTVLLLPPADIESIAVPAGLTETNPDTFDS